MTDDDLLDRVRRLLEVEPADLETVDKATRDLITRAELARQRAATLQSDVNRKLLIERVERYRTLHRNLEKNTATALDLSATLAETPYGTSPHADAASRFRHLAETIDTDQAQLADAATAAESATIALDLDERQRARHDPHVATDDAVHTALERTVRDRIGAAIARGARLPVWFTIALGDRPPADDTERWVQTATSLLMYRLTYAVTDPVVALGPPAEPGPRGTWRHDLDETMRALRG
jgi:hypothetical protein